MRNTKNNYENLGVIEVLNVKVPKELKSLQKFIYNCERRKKQVKTKIVFVIIVISRYPLYLLNLFSLKKN